MIVYMDLGNLLKEKNTSKNKLCEGYRGYLETDGYQEYNTLPGIRRCSCRAHIQRYFIDAVPKGKPYDYRQPTVHGVQYCNRLFAIEDSKTCSGDFLVVAGTAEACPEDPDG